MHNDYFQERDKSGNLALGNARVNVILAQLNEIWWHPG